MAVLAWVDVQQPERRHNKASADKVSADGVTADPSPESTSPSLASDDDQKEVDTWVRQKTDECHNWLDKAAKWETYVLETRIGMRVQTGMDTLRWFKRDKGWEV